MDKENLVEITGADLPSIIRWVYDNSVPVGLGVLHYHAATLGDDEVERIMQGDDGHCVLNMDYVNGRQCKFVIFRDKEDETLWIRKKWFDHEERSDDLIEFCQSTIS